MTKYLMIQVSDVCRAGKFRVVSYKLLLWGLKLICEMLPTIFMEIGNYISYKWQQVV